MSAAELRAAARASADAKQALRILAIAMALDGFSRAEAAGLCGMDRQTLRDWIHRYNEEGLNGLADRARSGRPASLSWVEQGKVASWVEQGADLARDGVVRFRRADLRNRIAAEFGVELHERSVGKLLRRLNFRRLSVRPRHPQSDPAAQEAFKKTSQT
jgi:transposase